MTAAVVVAILTLVYIQINWAYLTVQYRKWFIVCSVLEIWILAYAPIILIACAVVTSASKSVIERGDESKILDFSKILYSKRGSFIWHYVNSMMALLFTFMLNLVFLYFKS
jgi:hypothetical protein